ncbi:hypothetical protein DUNSADRAFT_14738 [Dunaliella salina]|uniref:Uncharacterized protein n=1 Tax=Dunaliella salina TaxID=3046 RepID=A0ABQ7H2E6_DUNSA|nr:hypothetical protein DUNSADRAFT_14738 [Dunaliella salina]|eukprot:KAF5841031.1 hypothetical protein DUNSADRAFT_14738 [Dunaliella salina]
MQQQKTGDPASKSPSTQSAIKLRLCTYIEDALGLGATSSADAAAQTHMLMRLLRVHRPLEGPGQQPQLGTPQQHQQQHQQHQQVQHQEQQQQQQEANATGAGAATLTSSSSNNSGGSRRVGSSSNSVGFAGAPVELSLRGLSDSLHQVAVRLEEGLGQAAGADRVLSSSHAQVTAALTRLLESGHNPAASLLQQLQDMRKRLLLAGDVPTLTSATAVDLDALDPAEFWGLYEASKPPPLLSLLGGGEPGTGFPDPNTLLPTPPLPHPEEIAHARASLPSSQLLLFDLLGDELQGAGAASELQVRMAFDALRKEAQLPNAPMVDELQLPPSYAAWAQETKQRLLGLTPPALALLARFLEVRLGRSREDASEAATRLQAEVAAKRANKRTAPSTSGAVNPYWVSPDSPQTEKARTAGRAAHDPYLSMLPSPEDVRALLGGGGQGFGSAEGEAAEFEAWLRSEALLGAESGARLQKQEGKAQPYELLAEQHLDMDIERFLTMEHDPQLHMCFEGAAPRPWRDPEGAALNEEAFLESMRPLLDRYLGVRGMRPLLDSEWQVYSGAALEEWSQKRGAHESALRAVGQSIFFNSRAESVYLRQLVATGIPAGAPLAEQAQRYLAVLDANPTWTFAQKKHAVKRLIELSSHFARQPPPSERGSPFAPLFAASSGKPSDNQTARQLVAPSLAAKEGQASSTPLPQGW